MVKCLIIRNIFKKIKFDNITIILGIFSLLIGYFKEYIYIVLLIIIHELGHSLASVLFHKDVLRINIYPFGGESIIDLNMNISIIKEIIIIIMGPIFQIIGTYFLIKFTNSYDDQILIKNISFAIIIFNLLPVYPLDGAKIINNILNLFFNIKKSFIISIIISYITIILLAIYYIKEFSISIFYMLLFLVIKLFKEKKEYKYNYNNFLIDRYLNKYHYKNKVLVYNVNSFFRNKRNIVLNDNKYYTEYDVLRRKFK